MNNDLTEHLPCKPQDTTPVIQCLSEKVYLLRNVDSVETRQGIANLAAHVDRGETKADADERMTAFEQRMKALEESRHLA